MADEAQNLSRDAYVSARGVSKAYFRRRWFRRAVAEVRALDGVDLDIRRGARLALVGESGAGKSTLARCLALLETPSAGEIRFDGRRLFPRSGPAASDARRQIQLVFQDTAAALSPRLAALEAVSEPLEIQRAGPRSSHLERAFEAMDRVGLPRSAASRLPQELSGGQRQRVALARALVFSPGLLILDEALRGLDLSIQAQVANLILDLQAELGLTVVWITHDLRMAARVAEEIAVLDRGRIVERSSAARLLRSPEHPATRALVAALPAWIG